MILKILAGLLALCVLGSLYVRLAPVDPKRWHVAVQDPVDKDFMGGAVRVVPDGADKLPALVKIATATPRTRLIAGSVDSGMVTFETRSLLWGFPDYTTVWVNGNDLVMHARLRFGKGDGGVNKARLNKWIAALAAS